MQLAISAILPGEQVDSNSETASAKHAKLEQTHKLNGIMEAYEIQNRSYFLLSHMRTSFHKNLTLEFRKLGNFSSSSSTE